RNILLPASYAKLRPVTVIYAWKNARPRFLLVRTASRPGIVSLFDILIFSSSNLVLPAPVPARPQAGARTHTSSPCVFRGLSDSDSNFCRTAFRFWPDTVPIHIGQCSGLRSDSFRAPLEWCPSWPGTVSDR